MNLTAADHSNLLCQLGAFARRYRRTTEICILDLSSGCGFPSHEVDMGALVLDRRILFVSLPEVQAGDPIPAALAKRVVAAALEILVDRDANTAAHRRATVLSATSPKNGVVYVPPVCLNQNLCGLLAELDVRPWLNVNRLIGWPEGDDHVA